MPKLITYDVSIKYTVVKTELLNMGLYDYWYDDKNNKHTLTNTTLLGEGTPEIEIETLHKAVDIVNKKQPISLTKVTIKTAAAVNWDKGCGIENNPIKFLKKI